MLFSFSIMQLFSKILVLCLFLFLNEISAQTKIDIKIDSLWNVYNQTKDPLRKSTTLYNVGREYMSVNIDSAIRILKQVDTEALQLRNDSLQAKSLIGLGLAYSRKSKLDSAKVYYDKAETIVAKSTDTDLKTSLYNNRGILFFYKSEYDKAREEFERVLAIAKEINNLDDISRSYNNIALCDSYSGNYESALAMHIESAKIAESRNDNLNLARSYNNIGLLYRDLDDYDKSEEYLLKSLKLKEEEGSTTDIIGGYLNLGGTLRKIGVTNKDTQRLLEARGYYEKALQKSKEANYGYGENISYPNLALIETAVGNFDKGILYGKIALKNSIDKKDIGNEIVSRVNLGDAYRNNKQYKLATEQLMKGYELAVEREDLIVQKEASLMISLLNSDQYNYKTALEYYKTYHDLTDSISSTDVKNKVNELETKYETEKKEKQILIQRAELAEQDLVIQKRNYQLFGTVGTTVIIGMIGFLFYNQQKLRNRQLQKENELKDALLKIETQNKLQEQRLRISRDLHDNIGAQLTFIISSIDNLKYAFKIEDNKLTKKLDSLSDFASGTIYELRDTIWAMNKSEISFEDLQARISNYIDKADIASNSIDFHFDVDRDIDEFHVLSSIKGMNVYRIIQEAIHNSIKYADASKISVAIIKVASNYVITVKDDGKGFDKATVKLGNGLKNMEKRASEIGGSLVIVSEENKGTAIILNV